MTPKKFFDWQTAGGADDVMRLVESHPELWQTLDYDLQAFVERPSPSK